MGEVTTISWTNATWNPVTGCTKVSPGCSRCYAEAIDHRFDHDKVGKLPWDFPVSKGGRGITLHPDRLDLPLRWKRPRMIFVNSMSDLFHEDVPFEFIAKVWDTMFDTSGLSGTVKHVYQILTKRPERMLAFDRWMNETQFRRTDQDNIWKGVSVENQLWAERRIPILAEIPAAVRFVSVEPLLGPVDLRAWLHGNCEAWGGTADGRVLDWVICGGESGPRFRPMDLDWARRLRDQCQQAGMPFFFKQSSGPRPGMNRELDGRFWEELAHAQRG